MSGAASVQIGRLDLLHLAVHAWISLSVLDGKLYVLAETPTPDVLLYGELIDVTDDGAPVLSGVKIEQQDKIDEIIGVMCVVLDPSPGVVWLALHILLVNGEAEAVFLDVDGNVWTQGEAAAEVSPAEVETALERLRWRYENGRFVSAENPAAEVFAVELDADTLQPLDRATITAQLGAKESA